MCAYAAARGAHIICQKPLARCFETSRRIVENARAVGVRFMVHENWRWQTPIRQVARLLGRGPLFDRLRGAVEGRVKGRGRRRAVRVSEPVGVAGD